MFSSFEYEERKIEHFREQDTLANGVDSIRNLPFSSIRYWYAFSFYDSFKDDNDYKNEQKIDRFIEQSKVEITSKDFNNLSYFRRLVKGRDYRQYRKALNKFETVVSSDAVLLLGEKKPFGERNIKLEQNLFWVSLVGLISMILFIFIPALNDEALNRFKRGKKPIENNSTFEEFIIPNKEIWVTQSVIYILLGVQLLIILNNVPVMSPSLSEIRAFGTSDGNLISEGESWRFITALFINGGAPILFLVITSFAFLGGRTERILGHFKLLLILSTIGIGTNMITYFINLDSHLFGFLYTVTGFAAFLCILKLFKDKIFKNEDLIGVFRLSVYVLLISVVASLFNIDSDFTIAIFISIGIGVFLGFVQFLLNRFS